MAWFLAPLAGAAIGGLTGAALAGSTIAGVTLGVNAGLYGAVAGGMLGTGAAQAAGASKQAEAAREQARLSNEATDRAWAYDMDVWDLERQRLDKNREYAYETVAIQARNEGRLKEYQDATRGQSYLRELQIRNFDQRAAERQYERSDDIFVRQLTLNSQSANAASRNELISLQEQQASASFSKQEALIENMKAEGELRARGQAGRSVNKTLQAEAAAVGLNMSMLSQSLANAERTTKAALDEIQRDKTSADLTAYANKMLDPGILPYPLLPFETPLTEWQYPDEIEAWEYGPMPVPGVKKSPNAAANMVWGQATSSIASTLGSGVMQLAGLG